MGKGRDVLSFPYYVQLALDDLRVEKLGIPGTKCLNSYFSSLFRLCYLHAAIPAGLSEIPASYQYTSSLTTASKTGPETNPKTGPLKRPLTVRSSAGLDISELDDYSLFDKSLSQLLKAFVILWLQLHVAY